MNDANDRWRRGVLAEYGMDFSAGCEPSSPPAPPDETALAVSQQRLMRAALAEHGLCILAGHVPEDEAVPPGKAVPPIAQPLPEMPHAGVK